MFLHSQRDKFENIGTIPQGPSVAKAMCDFLEIRVKSQKNCTIPRGILTRLCLLCLKHYYPLDITINFDRLRLANNGTTTNFCLSGLVFDQWREWNEKAVCKKGEYSLLLASI